MKRTAIAFALGMFVASTAWGLQQKIKRSTFQDEVVGYNFEVPRFPNNTASSAGVKASFTASPTDGFASNVNILVQEIKTTRDAFREESKKGVDQLGLKFIEDRDVTISGRDAVRYEYAGTLQNRQLHFMGVAIIDKDRVILLTGTALEAEFPSLQAEFKASLDSFQLK